LFGSSISSIHGRLRTGAGARKSLFINAFSRAYRDRGGCLGTILYLALAGFWHNRSAEAGHVAGDLVAWALPGVLLALPF
jgi:hypothetical protein